METNEEILNSIPLPFELKKKSLKELYDLAETIRNLIKTKTSVIGGNVASNLAVVEATIALHRVFNTPTDKIIFDTSHSTYAHKILTGRAAAYVFREHYRDIINYTSPDESEYDLFELGHTSTSISIAIGMAKARDFLNGEEYVVAFIGEGSLGGGVALEGLSLASGLSKFIIVLNDNNQSIAENQGALYSHLSKLRKNNGEITNNIFTHLGYEYIYVDDGHNITKLISAFEKAKQKDKSVVVHIATIKGKGFKYAEMNPEEWHYHSSYIKDTGETSGKEKWGCEEKFANYIIKEQLTENSNVVILTAGTPSYIGFDKNNREIASSKHFIDVGICEQSALAVAAGLAKRGICPVFAVQYTFLQRAYDQLYVEIALNHQPVIIVAFASGLYGISAKTHMGLCTIPMLTDIPELTVIAPSTNDEFIKVLDWSIKKFHKKNGKNGPVAIIAPCKKIDLKSFNEDFGCYQIQSIEPLKWTHESEVSIIAVGDFYDLAHETAKILCKDYMVKCNLIRPRILSELDTEVLERIKDKSKVIVTIENGSIEGGFGQKIAAYFQGTDINVLVRGLKKQFINCFNIEEILKDNRLKPNMLASDIIKLIK